MLILYYNGIVYFVFLLDRLLFGSIVTVMSSVVTAYHIITRRSFLNVLFCSFRLSNLITNLCSLSLLLSLSPLSCRHLHPPHSITHLGPSPNLTRSHLITRHPNPRDPLRRLSGSHLCTLVLVLVLVFSCLFSLPSLRDRRRVSRNPFTLHSCLAGVLFSHILWRRRATLLQDRTRGQRTYTGRGMGGREN